jgi:uncharacterized protein YndB with AHSA1/START domain
MMKHALNSGDRRAIVVDYDLSAPPSKVWRALTEPQLLESWLMPNDIKAEVGHRFTFKTAPAPRFDGVVQCEVLEVVHGFKLVYSWRGGPVDTRVTWLLRPAPADGTELRLEQTGFEPEHGFAYDLLSNGWRQKAAVSLERVASSVE